MGAERKRYAKLSAGPYRKSYRVAAEFNEIWPTTPRVTKVPRLVVHV